METHTKHARRRAPRLPDARIVAEIKDRLAHGQIQVTLAQWSTEIKKFGYRFDRSMDCRCNAQYMTGPRAGETYPHLSLGVVESDTGISWANIAARQDARREQLKALREAYFAVVRGHVASW